MCGTLCSAGFSIRRLPVLLLALGVLAGCASSDVTSRRSFEGEIAKPARVIVYDFSATPQDVPADSVLAGQFARRDAPQSEEEIALGRDLGARVAKQLVEDLNALGIRAERAADGAVPKIGDGVIKGAFVSVDEGSRVKRMIIGFGAGAAELKTVVEGYQLRETGLFPLGSAEIEAGGGKMPGVLAPVGIGAAAGRAATSAVVSGGAAVVKEVGPESIEAASLRTAEEISKIIEEAYRKRGWL